MHRTLPLALALFALSLMDPAATTAAAASLRMTTTAFGVPLEVEASGSAGVEAAMREAVTAVHEMEALVDLANGPLAALNAAAGGAPQTLPAALVALLRRAAEFCHWSEGAYGPLGGRVHELWGLHRPVAVVPRGAALDEATAVTTCDRLQIDAAGKVTLAAGARLDLWGFARGAAVDAALARLAERGVTNASVGLGDLQRGVGAGPAGEGWPLRVTVAEPLAALTRRLSLRDQAFALASGAAGALRAGGGEHPPYLHHRSGRPPTGVLAVAVVTDRALDAEALAVTTFVTGNRRGAVLLGQLRPSPAVLWLLGGEGGGTGLVTDYRWGSLPRPGTTR